MGKTKFRQESTYRALCVALVAAATVLGCNSDLSSGAGSSGATAGASSNPGAGAAAAPVDITLPCATAPALFTTAVGPSIASTCVACHTSGGLAAGTRLVFAATGASVANYNVLRTFAQTASDTLLSKTVGQPAHAGGAPYMNTGSQQYKDLAALVPEMKQACAAGSTPISGPVAGQFWQGVSFIGNSTTLAKAAVLFAGRNPTDAETQAVATGGDAVLRQTIRGYMTGAPFDMFLNEAGNTQFLTPGVVVFGDGGLNAADWPTAAAVISNDAALPAGVRNRFQASVRREPIELLKYIVNNDKPYTDMVAGNYTVVNGVLAQYLGAQVQGTFTNVADDNEWRMATLPSARLGGIREHTGVLSTHAWLNRNPTTATNRNRHRANVMFKQFLATDIQALAVRPLNTDNSAFKVPTIENPACAVCHDTMDPVAGGFQNWNEMNRYLPNRTAAGKDHALPNSYRSGNYPKDAAGKAFYVDGDNWFRDDKAPGFGATVAPGGFTGNPTALQWLGMQAAADSRFALGAVQFWYEAVFGRKALTAPNDTTAPQYANQLSAYNAQKDEFAAIATAFGTDRGFGKYNTKDLLADLVLSKWFRADKVTGLTASRAIELQDLGSVNLLLPSQLNQKLLTLVGQGYPDFNNPYASWALSYGDFDGNTRTTRAKSYTMMQTIGIDRLVANRSCTFTKGDFDKPQASRLLFPAVTMADLPGTATGDAAIVANVRYLHKWLLKEDLAATDPEVLRTVKLFNDVWADRATASDKATTCAYNTTNDPNYTGRAWAAVVAYLLGDAKFLYE